MGTIRKVTREYHPNTGECLRELEEFFVDGVVVKETESFFDEEENEEHHQKSAEHRRALSESMKASWAKRKAGGK